MKKIVFFCTAAMCALFALSASAATLTTTTGKVFHNAELKKISAGRATIGHDGGTAVLELVELPESFIAALGVRQRYALQSRIDLALADGRLLKGSSIVELGNHKVTLAHAGGVEEIDVALLPAYYIATFTPNQMRALNQTEAVSAKEVVSKNAAPENVAPAAIPPASKAPEANAANASADGKSVERDEQGREIFTGPRGGRYYLTEDGKKVYVRKAKQ